MYALPEKYKSVHQFSFSLHGEIVLLLQAAEQEKVFMRKVKFKCKEDADAFARSSDPLDWLHKSIYDAEASEVFKAALTPALIADFCHFVYEALSCSERAKLTNCFYQLRRPLKDNLFVLEWLLADSKDYLRRFRFKDPSEYAVEEVSKDRKLEIIEAAMQKAARASLNAQFIYDIRYNKQVSFGMEPLFQKAVHLVTTKPAYATERQNLNFIFSGKESRESQWDHLYHLLPYLLYYALGVIEALLEPYNIRRTPEQQFETDMGFILHNKSIEETQNFIHELGLDEHIAVN